MAVWRLAAGPGVFHPARDHGRASKAGRFCVYPPGAEIARRIAVRPAGSRGSQYATIEGKTVRSVARGFLGVALIQTILAGIGLLIMRTDRIDALSLNGVNGSAILILPHCSDELLGGCGPAVHWNGCEAAAIAVHGQLSISLDSRALTRDCG